MEESNRQKQVARLIQEEMSVLFQKENLNMLQGGMVSIAKVQMTPDLLEARIYLSFFQVRNPEEALAHIKEKAGTLRGSLGNQLRHQLRRIPYLQFFIDDTLEHAFKMEALLKKIKEEDSQSGKNPE